MSIRQTVGERKMLIGEEERTVELAGSDVENYSKSRGKTVQGEFGLAELLKLKIKNQNEKRTD
jgi:hypothetical protein